MSAFSTALLVLLSQTEAPHITPPRVLDAPQAEYPAGHQDAAEVDLRVLIGVAGDVTRVETQKSAGPDFDKAAEAAVTRWKFAPATMNGEPFEATLRVPFIFKTSTAPPPDGGTGPTIDADAGVGSGFVDAGAPLPTVTALPSASTDAGEPESSKSTPVEEVSVRGQQRKLERGGSDFQIEVGQQAINAGGSPEGILQLAPGIFIANEGGAGHADQVFLRGFNAEQGQAIEFTVNGVPINEVDNTDGHGYSDTHFIIPEVVKNLRVIEGPFDPHQGDFAEAGSADFELGVTERRLQVSAGLGNYNTQRLLILFAPEGEREGTFAAAQAERSDGFGTSRAFTAASGMAQYEGELGQRGLWRLLVTAYATHFKSAGAVRADDVASGRVDFYGSEDPSQGGDAQRYTASFSLENPVGAGVVSQQLFVTYRVLRLDEDFTGFLLDQDLAEQTPHVQRGDGILQQYSALTAGGRGSYKVTRRLFGQDQSIEVGYYARYDHTTPEIDRVRFGTQIPYLIDEDLITDVVNIAGFVDLDLHFGSRVTLRGGVRQEYFSYNVNNLCAAPLGSVPRGVPLDVNCETTDLGGPRLPNLRQTAAGLITEPKATALVKITSTLTATASFGIGAQSIDATLVSQDALAPFSQITAAEGGLLYHRRFERADLSARLVGYYTHVDHDLIFDPALGRLSPTGGTTRAGGVFAGRFVGPWYDELLSATYAYATYDADHTLVPYVPNLIARSDTAVFHALPWRIADHPIIGKAGLGLSFVGERALPFSQFAPPTFVVDATVKVRWFMFELGVQGQNLLNSRYASSEFFYASNFNTRPYPTLTPIGHFTAAAPLTIMATLSVIIDRELDR